MSIIVRAKIITITTKFRDEDVLLKALEKCNINFVKTENNIQVPSSDMEFVKQGGIYSVVFEGEIMDELETQKTQKKRKHINNILSSIETQYMQILNERIEMLKYKERMFDKIRSEKERKKQEILLKREREKLERIKSKREREKQKEIEEKVKKLREKAKMLGYEIEEKVEKNERVLVLVRRR
ncbi:MAG: hypothetical protein J7L08_04105 [Candidatus Aenigmarchaeota archaeon]|nr:hypothetical protein [Candidatus Aenigmarchaeota archaeon]